MWIFRKGYGTRHTRKEITVRAFLSFSSSQVERIFTEPFGRERDGNITFRRQAVGTNRDSWTSFRVGVVLGRRNSISVSIDPVGTIPLRSRSVRARSSDARGRPFRNRSIRSRAERLDADRRQLPSVRKVTIPSKTGRSNRRVTAAESRRLVTGRDGLEGGRDILARRGVGMGPGALRRCGTPLTPFCHLRRLFRGSRVRTRQCVEHDEGRAV